MAFADPNTGQRQQRPAVPGGATIPVAAPTPRDPNQGTSPASNPIPGADVYLGQENAANKAYEDAKNQLLSQRNSLYHSYGLDAQGAVDPNAQYGQYQMLLGNEGAALDSARNDSASRGIGGPGLGNQAESALRFGQGAEKQAFQNQVDQAGSDYSSGLINAQNTKSGAYLDAESQAATNALLNQLFNQAKAPSSDDTGGATTPPVVPPGPGASAAKKLLTQQLATLSAKKVTANKTGATVQKGRGVISIH